MRISSKLVLFALSCSILPLLAAFALSFNAARGSLDATVKDNLMSRASEELAALQQRLVSAKQDLSLFGRLSVMQDVRFGTRSDRLQGDLDRFAGGSPDFIEILVADAGGHAVAATDPRGIDADLRGTWEYAAPRLGIVFDGPVVDSFRLNQAISTHAIPIFADADADVKEDEGDGVGRRVIGALIGSISWNALKDGLYTSTLFGARQGEGRQLVLQSTADDRILYATPGVAIPDALLESREGANAFRELAVGGRELLAASADSVAIPPFRDPRWRLHVVLDSDIAHASVNQLREWFTVVGAGVLVLVSLLAWWLARSITRPVGSLVNAAGRLAQGDGDEPLPGGGKDEIGQLAQSFESMRRAVRANERELIRKTEQSEAAARLKGEFLANMSHEVRTPINGVLGMTELLLATTLDAKQGRYAETIFRSGQSLLSVINDILDFSKIEAGKLEVQDVGFDLRELVEDVFEMVAESAHGKGLELALDMPPGAHVAYRGDANRIRQILLNLIGNAIKFTERGEVRLEVRAGAVEPGAPDAADPKADPSDDSRTVVSLAVVDTGIGIPESALGKVFESFVQADGSTTRRFGGTGLGLAISSRLAVLMGGAIDVCSTLGEGSTFQLDVPLRPLPASVSDAWRQPGALVGRRVLVVDDNACNREILESQMRFWSAVPTMADDGVHALAAVLEAQRAGTPFDLIVLDMQMPGMNGLELAATLYASGRVAGVPTMLLSSVCDQLDASACVAAGIDSVITKPVRQPELYRSLTALLGGPSDGVSEEVRGQAPKPHRALATRRLHGRILLVEDNPTNQFMMTEMLRQLGLQVIVADHGRAALDTLADRAGAPDGVDVVLMDCQMPVLDGFAATRQIRSDESLAGDGRRLPVIALTANALEGDREACLAAGMDEYLSKPVSAERLFQQLSVWLDDGGSRAVARSEPTEPEREASEPVLDRRVHDDLLAMANAAPAGFLDELIATWRTSAIEDMDGVRAGLEAGDAEAVASRAHRLKSSSANWGARRLAAQCATIEAAARSGDLDKAALPAGDLAHRFAEVLEAIDPPPMDAAA